ncbi:PhzF family phenazine biosynthesis protein [Variovorax paradoxus]|uniref:Putative isomerase YddE n=1 Tax=Variovorax paradoxus TaxID=34073 RepID=A0A0H2M1W8_VARPD|nr:PhzF family phenazine biosynthesis isomerase [Variovorax paradoxus]KLN56101.1 putative isomerase YddE [Variovorax paradoxus]
MNMAHRQSGEVAGIRVFVNGPRGGNPVPMVRNADGMAASDMQDVARRHGHESAFVFESNEPGIDWKFRFFVPNHEMEMCGHATVGTLWALRAWGEWTTPSARIRTLSGVVDAWWDAPRGRVWISQPKVRLSAVDAHFGERVCQVLNPQLPVERHSLVENATTSRVKTLVRMPTIAALDALTPLLGQIEATCASIDSTGLYPYAVETGADGTPVVAARQFPRSSGYPEDAATGIAAAALWGYLGITDAIPVGTPAAPVVTSIRQGEAMGSPSAIELQARFGAHGEVVGCWLSGHVEWAAL